MNASTALGDEDPPGQPRVLLVDDDEVNLLLTSIALRERGFAITEATSGERAIQVLADWLPDVVVLDAMMPGMDGFQTCRELRALPGFESLPVLMLTGLDDDASINRAYEAGATDFFVKSTQWSLLAGRLRYLLRSSRTRQELERSKSKLARAQDLARMGSFDWKREHGSPVFSVEGLRVFGYGPDNEAAWLDAYGWALQPRIVLLGFYVGNDVRDVMLGLPGRAEGASARTASGLRALARSGRRRPARGPAARPSAAPARGRGPRAGRKRTGRRYSKSSYFRLIQNQACA